MRNVTLVGSFTTDGQQGRVPQADRYDIVSVENDKELLYLNSGHRQFADAVLLRQANEAAAGQDVFHFHLHVIPRWTGGRKPATDEANKQAMLETIKAALGS